jgi:hypothetical protein
MSHFAKALQSFDGFKGAAMPTDPTNEAEFSALVNAVDGGSCWSGEAPTWEQVSAKVTELNDVDTQKATDKVTGKQKLKGLGLTDDEIKALIGI